MTAATTERLSDEQLMEALVAGEAECSLAALRERYRARVLALIRSVVRDGHLAEDLTQEVFAKLFVKRHLYRPGAELRPWLFAIARNEARTAMRDRRKTPRPVADLVTMSGRTGRGDEAMSRPSSLESLYGSYEDHAVHEQELMDLFVVAVDRLPEHYRVAFQRCAQEGQPYRQVASELGIPVGTVSTQVMRARRQLYEQLSPHVAPARRP